MRQSKGDLIKSLRSERITSWYDLGLFLDSLHIENTKTNFHQFGNYAQFQRYIGQSMAFINYDFGVDGVTIEAMKYEKVLKKIFKGIDIHWICGSIDPELDYFKSPMRKKFVLKSLNGFERWEPYMKLFHSKLERGTKDYNELAKIIWRQTLSIVDKLSRYFQKNNIRSMLITNVGSNPGNLSLTLAIVILSEKLGIPVISSNHDFYWEDGKANRKPGEKPGARDHFFTNHDLGEVFSLIQTLYPWQSRNWVHMNINNLQNEKLITAKGINPANTMVVSTTLDLNLYHYLSNEEKKKTINCLDGFFHKNARYIAIEDFNEEVILDESAKPLCIGIKADKSKNYFENSMIFLQPTRIIQRKAIEKDFDLLEALFTNRKFRSYLDKDAKRQIVLLISGPISPGQAKYFKELMHRVKVLFQRIPKQYVPRTKVLFSFGQFKNEDNNVCDGDIDISFVYGLSTLVLFPSVTEGRGLPIIESSAAYVPIAASRYRPKSVYSDLVGEYKSKNERIQTIEFPEYASDKKFIAQIVELITDESKYAKLVTHNRQVIERRFSYTTLQDQFDQAYRRLWLFITTQKQHKNLAREALQKIINSKKASLKGIAYVKKRKYLAGYNPLKYLFYLKSIIDPTYFRIEVLELRGRIFEFSRNSIRLSQADQRDRLLFYKAVEELFVVKNSIDKIITDFSFEFRYRNRIHLLYQDLTEQELMGAVMLIYHKLFGDYFDSLSLIRNNVNELMFKTLRKSTSLSWQDKVKLLSAIPAINTRARLSNLKREVYGTDVTYSVYQIRHFLKEVINKPQYMVYLPGGIGEIMLDLKFMAQDLLDYWSKKGKNFRIVFGVKEESFSSETTKKDVEDLLKRDEFSKLRKYMKKGLFKVVVTGSKSAGINLMQITPEFAREIKSAKKKGGILVAKGDHNYATLDCVDIDTFRLGKTEHQLSCKINGFAVGTVYLQFIPAGFRPTYAYPTPIYRSSTFSQILESKQFKKVKKKFGVKTFSLLKKDMDDHGYSLIAAIDKVLQRGEPNLSYSYSPITGLYKDRNPYNGVLVKVNIKKLRGKFKFEFMNAKEGYETVTSMIKRFKHKTIVAWNGGYSLNSELVGKLLLSKTYIGKPLGMIVTDSKILSLPLFNKPVFGVNKKGRITIGRCSVNVAGSIKIPGQEAISWEKSHINKENPNGVSVYTLLHPQKLVSSKDKVVIKLSGNTIMRVITNQPNCTLAPAGITIVLPFKLYQQKYRKYKKGVNVEYKLNLPKQWKDIEDALEAGPLLIHNGKIAINIKKEGWDTFKSIRTQASRLDYTHMRSPKIGVGVTAQGNLVIVAINARIRESVGATYADIANILKDHGAVDAIGFDPGGSTTVVFEGKQVNISPYNPAFEIDPFQGKPVPREVANSIIGYLGT